MSEFDAWRSAAGHITTGLMAAPQIKAMAAQRQMQNYSTQQQAQLHVQQSKALQEKGRLVTMLEQNGPQAVLDAQNGLTDTPAIRAVIAATSGLGGGSPGTVAKQFAIMLETQNAVRNKDATGLHVAGHGTAVDGTVTDKQWEQKQEATAKRAADINTSRERVAQTQADKPMSVPNQNRVFNPRTGQTESFGNVVLRPNERFFTPDDLGAMSQAAAGQFQPKGVSPGSWYTDENGNTHKVPSGANPDHNPYTKTEADIITARGVAAVKEGNVDALSSISKGNTKKQEEWNKKYGPQPDSPEAPPPPAAVRESTVPQSPAPQLNDWPDQEDTTPTVPQLNDWPDQEEDATAQAPPSAPISRVLTQPPQAAPQQQQVAPQMPPQPAPQAAPQPPPSEQISQVLSQPQMVRPQPQAAPQMPRTQRYSSEGEQIYSYPDEATARRSGIQDGGHFYIPGVGIVRLRS